MSSILNALKKLEDRDGRQKDVLPMAGGQARSVTAPAAGLRRFFIGSALRRVLAAGLLLALIVVMWFWGGRTGDDTALPVPVPMPVPAPAPVLSGAPQTSAAPPPVDRTVVSPKQVAERPAAVPPPASVARGPEKIRPAVKAEPPPLPVLQPETLFPKEGAVPDMAKPDSAADLSEGEITDTPPEGFDTIVLQAVAWAREPVRRMAVMDGAIVREGDVHNGVLVRQINENDVVLKKSGMAWRLRFKGR